MSIYDYEARFGVSDKTTKAMKTAIGDWFNLYYAADSTKGDPCQRIAYTVVNKLVKAVFGEYRAEAGDGSYQHQCCCNLLLCRRSCKTFPGC